MASQSRTNRREVEVVGVMRDKISTPRIDVTIGGVTFKNPFYVASGPTTKSVRQLVRIEETGWAAASIKLTIDPAPYINRLPRYGLFGSPNDCTSHEQRM